MSSTTASNAILTNSIDTITGVAMTIGDATASSIAIGSSTVGRTPTITIDTLSTANTNTNPAIAIGTSTSTKTIKIGNNNNSVHCSSVDLKGSAINNITNATGALSIGDLQTDGVLNIGAGTARTASGIINIGNSANANPIYVETSSTKNTDADPAIRIGVGGTGPKVIKIGNSNTGFNTTNVHINNLKIAQASLENVTTTSGDISIGAGQSSGVLYFGAGGGQPRSGAVQFATAPSTSSEVNFLTGTTNTGTVNFGTASTGTNSTKVNMLSGNTTGAFTVGNPSNITTIKSGTTNINTGAGTALVPLAGTTNIATGTGATFVSTAVNIATGDTTGTVTIGNSVNTTTIKSVTTNINTGVGTDLIPLAGTTNIATGTGATFVSTAVNIATGDTTGTVTIGNSVNTTTIKSVTTNINTGVGTDLIPLAGTVNIATGTGATFVSTAVNIATGNTTGTTTIGNSTNTVKINGALELGVGKNLKLQTGYVSPSTTTTFLGGTVSGSISTVANPVTGTVLGTVTIADAGLYLFTYNIVMPLTGTIGTTNHIVFAGTGAYTGRSGGDNTTSGQFVFNGCQVISASAGDYTVTLTTNTTTFTAPTSSYFKATRIA
jgi:hypothetical protein